MKKELTITVDTKTLTAAIRHARSRGMSLSSLVEQSLRNVAGQEARFFTRRWRGQFQAARHDEPRYDALARKYLTSKDT